MGIDPAVPAVVTGAGGLIGGTLRLMASDVSDPVNVGSSELVTVDELIDLVEDIVGVRLRRRYRLDAPQGVRGRNRDNSRAREVLGWEPETALRDGMEVMYAWIFDQLSARAR